MNTNTNIKMNFNKKLISVLAIDDEQDARDLYKDMLWQYSLNTAESASEALTLIEKNLPDIVVTDLKMPKNDGLVLLSRIKEDFPNILVIMVTGHGEKSTVISSVRNGAFDYLDKPIKRNEFLSVINRAEEYCLLQRKLQDLKKEKHRTFELQKILYQLLQTSQYSMGFKELMEKSLEIIIQGTSFLTFKSEGSIFIVEDKPHELTLKTHRNLPVAVHSTCSKISFGQCLCGKAAKEGKIIFSNCLDDNHHISYEGMKPHGHYCVPIKTKDRVVGVLNIFLHEGHKRDINEEKYLQAIADTLAGIIERKNMQSQLIQSSKLASIGILASGVAHELNNPLTTIMGHANLLINSGDNQTKIEDRAKKIKKASKRMEAIIKHLRTFAKEIKHSEQGSFEIVAPIKNSFGFLKTQFKLRGISINSSFNDCEVRVFGDMTQIESVFQNLLINSRDAFEQVKDNRSKQISITTLVDGENVKIIYEDNAIGIPENILDSIFDPFFTTKEAGMGTGLGLSLTRNIVDQHKGTIAVESVFGEGTKFIISLPLYRRKSKNNELKSTTSSFNLKQGTKEKRILVIDDDIEVANVTYDLLESFYEPNVITNSIEALKNIENEKYDLILTDLKMPNASGIDIVLKTKKHQPNTPVIIMSGFGKDDKDLKTALAEGAKAYLSKPFGNFNELLSLLDSYIDSK